MRFKLRRLVYEVLGKIDLLLKKESKVIVLCYHSISNDGWRFSIPISEFKKQMEHLTSRRTPITLSMLEKYLNKEINIDKPVFILTFDDGYRDLMNVRSFLNNRGIKPCVFLIADSRNVDRGELENKKPLLTNKDVKQLIADGWEIGSHSLTHANFNKLDERKLIKEIFQSKKDLIKRHNGKIDYFSYPKGYYTKEIEKKVKDSGYKLAVSMDAKMIDINTPAYSIPREGVDGSHSFTEFKSLISPSVIRFKGVVKYLMGKFI